MPVAHSWISKLGDDHVLLKYGHMVSIAKLDKDGKSILAAAWQASVAEVEGSFGQHIRFSTSADGGATWTSSQPMVWGLLPCWSPVLHSVPADNRLLLFYTESRKAPSPGGDIKCLESLDCGETWSTPRLIWSHEAEGGIPKVIANKLLVTRCGRWVLPFWREPPTAHRRQQTFHPLQLRAPVVPADLPPGAQPECQQGSAGVLTSDDNGRTWFAFGMLRNPDTWLIENSLEQLLDGTLVMLFRTSLGRVYRSVSRDVGETWSVAAATELPNPDSKVASARFGDELVLAYNPSTTTRCPLVLAASKDGEQWRQVVTLEDKLPASESGNFSYPTVIQWDSSTIKVAYTVWGKGLRLATVSLPHLQ